MQTHMQMGTTSIEIIITAFLEIIGLSAVALELTLEGLKREMSLREQTVVKPYPQVSVDCIDTKKRQRLAGSSFTEELTPDIQSRLVK